MIGIYSIFNTVSGNRYIGQAVDVMQRIAGHFKRLRAGKHHCAHLQLAFQKYGQGAFVHSVLEECSRESLTDREQYWMDYYRDRGIYNTAPAAGTNAGLKLTQKARMNISAGMMGHAVSCEAKDRMSAARMGWNPSTETRAKMSAAKRNMSAETKVRMSAAHKGVKLSEAHREGLRKSHEGKPHAGHVLTLNDCANGGKKAQASITPETRAKITASLMGNKRRLGIPITEEVKVKISKALKGRKRPPELVARIVASRWGMKQTETMPVLSGQI